MSTTTLSKRVLDILANYSGETSGTKAGLARLMMSGACAGTGRLIILPVDQGFEHGPDRSFIANPDGYDPLYHLNLAIEAKLSGYAAPLGMIELAAEAGYGRMPLILKMNSSMSWSRLKNQAVTASVDDALRLGCTGIGFTIYPGSDDQFDMYEEFRDLAKEAKKKGLVVVLWSYPRGETMDKTAEQALDVTAYAAHIATLLGAHIIKVKPPSEHIAQKEAQDVLGGSQTTLNFQDRIRHIVRSTFAGRRIVIFSGGASKSDAELLDEVKAIHKGGGNGSIVGRNAFQRTKPEALKLLQNMCEIYCS